MNNNKLMKVHKKTGRICYLMPWKAKAPCPWKSGYERVLIPFTEKELRHAHPGKTCHIQIVRTSNLEAVKEVRYGQP